MVTVSLPTMVSVSEDDEAVSVCASLTAVENTQRDFTVTVTTSDGSGTPAITPNIQSSLK